MKKSLFTLEKTEKIAGDVFALSFCGDTSGIVSPGQFVEIELPGKFLRRPISVADWKKGRLLLLVKEVGSGTNELVNSPIGTEFDMLTGLGNGFDISKAADNTILAGGGIGIAPLYGLARRLTQNGIFPRIALGFRSAADSFYADEFGKLGCEVRIATEDGSLGSKGFVTSLFDTDKSCYVFACGPLPMLKAIHSLTCVKGGQFSFEARMGCGFGACMGCTVRTADGCKRICKDGPILFKEEIVW